MTILRESSSLLLNTFLQLLQNMGPNILHSEFLNFVRNVSEGIFMLNERRFRDLDSTSLRERYRQAGFQSFSRGFAKIWIPVQWRFEFFFLIGFINVLMI